MFFPSLWNMSYKIEFLSYPILCWMLTEKFNYPVNALRRSTFTPEKKGLVLRTGFFDNYVWKRVSKVVFFFMSSKIEFLAILFNVGCRLFDRIIESPKKLRIKVHACFLKQAWSTTGQFHFHFCQIFAIVTPTQPVALTFLIPAYYKVLGGKMSES